VLMVLTNFNLGELQMKKTLIVLICLLMSFILLAKLRVVTAYPYMKDIADKIGKGKIRAAALSPGNWDPHVIVPKPSLIAQVRRADLLIINGGQLEIGWIPPVIRQANNAKVMPGKRGFLDLSNFVKLIQVPDSISRAQGDIHPAGNPHFHLDPQNIPLLAEAIANKLIELDPDNMGYYTKNKNEFLNQWTIKIAEWETKLAPLKGTKYIEFHKNFDYFLQRFGLIVLDTIEPLPGIPPTSKHTIELIKKIKSEKVAKILHDVYHSSKCTKLISQKTDVPWVIIPHDVRAVKKVKDIFSLYDEIVMRLMQ
jgi:zinc/manganese transport system substrate-binding protein